MNKADNTSPHAIPVAPRRGVVTGLVYMFEQVMPDPFVLSICLTLVVILLAVGLAPNASFPAILTAWYTGTFNILGFALQMILILATGYAIADAPLIQSGLRAMAAGVQTTDKGGTCRFSYCCDRFMVELGPGAGRWRVACTRDRQARESRFRMARGRQLLSVVCLQ
jgi:short-chain fatty acids transporter